MECTHRLSYLYFLVMSLTVPVVPSSKYYFKKHDWKVVTMRSKQSHWFQLEAYATVAALYFVSSTKLFLAVPVKIMTSPTGLLLFVFNYCLPDLVATTGSGKLATTYVEYWAGKTCLASLNAL